MSEKFRCPDVAVAEMSQAIEQALQTAFSQTLAELGVTSNDIAASISQPPQREWGDYAFPCFRFAKPLKKSPDAVAQALADAINANTKNKWIESTNILKGFLNFKIDQKILASYILPLLKSGAYFDKPGYTIPDKKNVMIEYSQPNTHKVFHIGHVRNVCLGDSLCRIYQYCGFNVMPVNYIGDEGTHIAECLWYWVKHDLKDPGGEEERVEALEQAYVGAKKEVAEADEPTKARLLAEIGKVHHELEAGRGEYYKKWLETKAWCMEHFLNMYKWLDSRFDHYFFESEMTEESQQIVEEFLKKGVFKLDQGAVGLSLDDKDLGFCMLRKSNGATLYATKDLALARRKFDKYKVDRSIYVVAAEQNRHFQQVFATLERMGFPQAKDCYHLSYAFVRLPDGKMSTRKGSAVHFTLVRDEILKELGTYLEKYQDKWTTEEIAEAAHRLALCAIRYGMLSTDPNKEIIFQIKDWLSFEGNTGPYLMYSYSRAQSVLRKAAELGFKPKYDNFDLIVKDEEYALLRYFYDFNKIVLQSCENYYPTALCGHLFYMSKEFNRYYANVPILKNPDDPALYVRLAIIESFGKTLAKGLSLLGIPTIERM